MKILLLGANGQLAQDIRLVHSESFENTITLTPWTRENVDVTDLVALKDKLSAESFDVLINCTSYHKTEEVESHPDIAFLTNAHAIAEMAKVCDAKNAKFVHISTDYVFGYHHLNRPLTETDNAVPFNVYGASKLMGEGLAQQFCSQSYILRVASLYGLSGSTAKGGNFVTTMMRLGKERDELTVVNDQFMSPTWTYDIAVAIFKLLEKDAEAGLYHMAGTGVTSWYDFAKAIFEIAEIDVNVKPVPASQFPAKVVRPFYSGLDNAKIKKATGFDVPEWNQSLKQWFSQKKLMTV